MEITGPPLNLLSPQQLQATLKTWQVGQVLQALVVRQATPQSAILQINNQQLQADTNVTLTPGQRLLLTVVQTGDKPVLQAKRPDTAPPNQPATMNTTQAANTILKQALPRQTSLSTLLANAVWLNQQASSSNILPKPILDLVKQLVQQLPDKSNLTNPGQMKQNVLNSGIFLENKLNQMVPQQTGSKSGVLKQALKTALPNLAGKESSTTPAAPMDKSSADIKLTLLRLLTNVQQIIRSSGQTAPTPQGQAMTTPTMAPPLPPQPFVLPTLRGQPPQPQGKSEPNLAGLSNSLLSLLFELGRQTEGALSRTQLHQAASLPAGEQAPNSWAFELPIRNNDQIDIFDIVIDEEAEQERDNEDENKRQWSVTLAFDLPGLGPVYAKLKLADDKVGTTFWAETPETTKLFNQHLSELRQRYQQSGIEASELACYQGKPADNSGKLPHIVLDMKA